MCCLVVDKVVDREKRYATVMLESLQRVHLESRLVAHPGNLTNSAANGSAEVAPTVTDGPGWRAKPSLFTHPRKS